MVVFVSVAALGWGSLVHKGFLRELWGLEFLFSRLLLEVAELVFQVCQFRGEAL